MTGWISVASRASISSPHPREPGRPVSPRLATVRRLLLVVWGGLAAVVWGLLTIGLGATVASVLAVIGAIGLAVIVLAGALGMLFIGHVVRRGDTQCPTTCCTSGEAGCSTA